MGKDSAGKDSDSPVKAEGKPFRDKRGRILPGAPCLNPSGRPKSKHVSEALRKMMEEGAADEVARILYSKIKDGNLQAIDMALDRVEGRPIQAHRIEASIDQATAERLAELAQLLRDKH